MGLCINQRHVNGKALICTVFCQMLTFFCCVVLNGGRGTLDTVVTFTALHRPDFGQRRSPIVYLQLSNVQVGL